MQVELIGRKSKFVGNKIVLKSMFDVVDFLVFSFHVKHAKYVLSTFHKSHLLCFCMKYESSCWAYLLKTLSGSFIRATSLSDNTYGFSFPIFFTQVVMKFLFVSNFQEIYIVLPHLFLSVNVKWRDWVKLKIYK